MNIIDLCQFLHKTRVEISKRKSQRAFNVDASFLDAGIKQFKSIVAKNVLPKEQLGVGMTIFFEQYIRTLPQGKARQQEQFDFKKTEELVKFIAMQFFV